MLLSEAIRVMESIKAERGDLKLVSGLDRCGYGEALVSLDVRDAHPYVGGDGVFADHQDVVVDLLFSEETSYSSTTS